MKIVMPIILILLSIGTFFLLIDPKYTQIQNLQAEIKENNRILDIAARLTEQRNQLRKKYTEIATEEKQVLEKLLPDTVDNVRLIIDIDSIAKQYGIVIRDMEIISKEEENVKTGSVVNQDSNFDSFSEESSIKYVDKSKIGVISFTFSVVAQYDVFLEFLNQLEESLRIVDIRNIEITRNAEEGVFYDYKVTLDTYWLK